MNGPQSEPVFLCYNPKMNSPYMSIKCLLLIMRKFSSNVLKENFDELSLPVLVLYCRETQVTIAWLSL